MLVIAGGIVLGWLAIAVIRALASSASQPTPEELEAAADRLRDVGK